MSIKIYAAGGLFFFCFFFNNAHNFCAGQKLKARKSTTWEHR